MTQLTGSTWICLNLSESVRTCLNLFGSVWTCLDLFWFVWICLRLFGSDWNLTLSVWIWICLFLQRLHGSVWIFQKFHISEWVFLALPRLTWICLRIFLFLPGARFSWSVWICQDLCLYVCLESFWVGLALSPSARIFMEMPRSGWVLKCLDMSASCRICQNLLGAVWECLELSGSV